LTFRKSGDVHNALIYSSYALDVLKTLVYTEGRFEFLGDYAMTKVHQAALLLTRGERQKAAGLLDGTIPILKYEHERTHRNDLEETLKTAEKLHQTINWKPS
ncbi:hypothetical protein JW979_04590, partial [bacterium]|nr:hypothetical protein [candidate division CSSED10-310 bacterium]